jgi:predicted dehydrogenase
MPMKSKGLKAVILGCGSIGSRHLRNLKALGIGSFILCDPNHANLKKAKDLAGRAEVTDNMEDAIRMGPDAAVIATPSSMHLPMAKRLAMNGIHLFIEKPLSDTLSGAEELKRLVTAKGVVATMAMCYRFHPVFLKLKEMLSRSVVGRPYHANYYGGHYLPDWHPYADYRGEYAAQKRLGGGVVLTSIHGIDNIRWLFGDALEVHAFIDRVSGLEMDVEDIALAVLRLENGMYVSWQTDFLQRANQHRMVIVGEKGTIRCDFIAGLIEVFTVERNSWEEARVQFEINSMYLDEMRHFIQAIKGDKVPAVSIEEGIKTLGLALRVKEGCRCKNNQRSGALACAEA